MPSEGSIDLRSCGSVQCGGRENEEQGRKKTRQRKVGKSLLSLSAGSPEEKWD